EPKPNMVMARDDPREGLQDQVDSLAPRHGRDIEEDEFALTALFRTQPLALRRLGRVEYFRIGTQMRHEHAAGVGAAAQKTPLRPFRGRDDHDVGSGMGIAQSLTPLDHDPRQPAEVRRSEDEGTALRRGLQSNRYRHAEGYGRQLSRFRLSQLLDQPFLLGAKQTPRLRPSR